MSYNMMNSYQNSTNRAFSSNNSIEKATKMCDFKDMYALRKDLIGELEAINQYDLHIGELSSEKAKMVLESIRNEEIVHTGELLALMDFLCPAEAKLRAEGKQEAMEIIGQSSKG